MERADTILQQINDATGEKQDQLMKQYGSVAPFSMILSLNFNDKIILDLPDGPPTTYKKDTSTHPDLFPRLANSVSQLKQCVLGVNTPRWKKIGTFLDVVDSLCPAEQDILLFAKDRALTELYPNITPDLVSRHFPSYVNTSFIE